MGRELTRSAYADDLDVKGDDLAGQRMIEVNLDYRIMYLLDHARQLAAGGVGKDHQQPRLQLHLVKLIASNGLNILLVTRTEAALGLDLETAAVADLETEQHLFKTGLPSPTLKVAGCLSVVVSTTSPLGSLRVKCRVTSDA